MSFPNDTTQKVNPQDIRISVTTKEENLRASVHAVFEYHVLVPIQLGHGHQEAAVWVAELYATRRMSEKLYGEVRKNAMELHRAIYDAMLRKPSFDITEWEKINQLFKPLLEAGQDLEKKPDESRG